MIIPNEQLHAWWAQRDYTQLLPHVRRIAMSCARRIVHELPDAAEWCEDVASELTVRVMARETPPDYPAQFLVSSAVNLAIDRVGKSSYFRRRDRFSYTNMVAIPDESPDPLDRVLHHERVALVHRTLSRMRPDRADLIRMWWIEELPYEVITARLGIKDSAARMRMARSVAEFTRLWRTIE